MLFLHDWTDAAKQAEYAKRIYYTGTARTSSQLLPQDKLQSFPTSPENKASRA